MSENLNDEANDNGKGLSVLVLLNTRTGKDRVAGVRYRKRVGHRGLLLNRCPWCAERIDFIVQDQEQKRRKTRQRREQRAQRGR